MRRYGVDSCWNTPGKQGKRRIEPRDRCGYGQLFHREFLEEDVTFL